MIDLKGKKLNKLTVLYKESANRSGSIMWRCVCECGNEKSLSNDHLTRKTNPVKSCGCYRENQKGPNHRQWQGAGKISGSWWSSHILRAGSKRKNKIEINIDINYGWELFLKQEERCALSNLPLKFGLTAQNNTASLDRIDSQSGYIIGNVQWVHKHVNFMKGIYSQDYFIKICNLISKHNKIGEIP